MMLNGLGDWTFGSQPVAAGFDPSSLVGSYSNQLPAATTYNTPAIGSSGPTGIMQPAPPVATTSSIISGIPNTYLYIGGAALLLIVLMKKK